MSSPLPLPSFRASCFCLLLFVVACGGARGTGTPNLVVIPVAASAEPVAVVPGDPIEPPHDDANWSDAEATVPVSSRDPMDGRRDALVTMVVFSDFQCPYCGRVRPTMQQVRDAYTPDQLRLVWKNDPLPFHPNARPAAEAAEGVFELRGSEAFWHFHDIAFRNQAQLSRESYLRWADDVGVQDGAAFEQGLDTHRWAPKVEEDLALAGKVGANGTPTFFVNGVILVGAQPVEKFKELVDKELAKAEGKVAHGTPRDRVYVVMSQENKVAPPKDDDDAKDDSKPVWKIPVAKEPARGPSTALVTIVEFSDFQCPFCARVEPTLAALRTKYGSDLRIVWRNGPLPFHPRALPAAELALEARAEKGDAGFWAAHDALFADQTKLDDASLEKAAAKLGLDVGRVRGAIKNETHKALINADLDVADDFQANGTPHFFINGRRLVGAHPLAKFEKLIDEELLKARALVAKGTAPANVYAALTKGGAGPPALEKKSVLLAPNLPFKGSATAKVVIQEFADFQCPFCKRAEDALDEVMRVYGSRVKLVWRNLPLPMHSDAPLAAQAATEAFKQRGSAGFWKMHDLLYSNPQDLKRQTLDGYAQQMGLDMSRWNAALDHETHKAAVDAEAQVANAAGISGTPAFVINGYFISGAQPFAKFRKAIERALVEAK